MPYYKRHMKDQIRRAIFDVKERVYTAVTPLSVEAFRTKEPVSYADRMSGERITPAVDEKWGELWDCAWFHMTGSVPESLKGEEIVLKIDISGEACIFNDQGEPVKGLTTFTHFWDDQLGGSGKRIYKYIQKANGGESIDLWLDAGNNDLFGNEQGSKLRHAHICTLNEDMRQLYYDLLVLNDMLRCLPEKSSRYQRIFFALYKAVCLLSDYTDEEIASAREILGKELSKKGGDPSLTVTAIGHSHMDLAWLWPIRETKRKIARTFATVLELMERYPNYRYGASQPQQFEWVKEYYPKMYEDIKKRVKEGRFEVQGGMWVEADTNTSGGEALVRQFLYGKRYFNNEFGIDVKNLWLPDVFGYSGALPQILKKSGVDYFMTQKLSWNEHNRFPHHTFNWEGIDGTKVLAHMLPEDTYNGASSPCGVNKIDAEYMDSGVCNEALMLFGIGDGGGGPSAGHLECMDRMQDLSGLVPVKQGFASDFFERIAKNTDDYITYRGELYLEKHQGTFTTQANNKKYNRLMEINLRELEFAAVLCGQAAGTAYPKAEIDEIWKEVLLYQFHDILPGSSIKRVYDESVPRYKTMLERVKEMTGSYYKTFAKSVKAPAGSYIVFNSTSYEREEWVETGDTFARVKVPAMGYTVVQGVKPCTGSLKVSEDSIENEHIIVHFNKDGSVSKIVSKELCKNILKNGARSNVLSLYEDRGDCWDIPITYRDKVPHEFKLECMKSYTEGVYAVMEQFYAYGKSKLTQKIRVTANDDRVDFVTHVDWQEDNLMLRSAFITDVMTDEVTCRIQYGKIKRAATTRTSQDMAQFEIPAHDYIDMSGAGYGVALLNDCKYGFYAKDGILDIDLLRSQNSPGKDADKGEHDFTYSIYAHSGDQVTGGVTKAGYALNHPLIVCPAGGDGSKPSSDSLFTVDKDNIIIETVKIAEDSGDIILRLYDSEGLGGKVSLTLPDGITAAAVTDMLENDISAIDIENGKVALAFHPFEIHTLKLCK